ncbi:MAG: mannonate dehydratase [Tannerellaceae bacterium]|jgi:mannonate dehydratase|nr:mannonate dehydratase [Tannerellaceae bacterium]
MKKTWRWFGKKDRITFDMLRQIGVEGIVTALYDTPNGEVWETEAIREVKHTIENAGFHWAVVESLPVAETIKYGGKDRDTCIEHYKQSLANLGRAGIRTVCYNFMPVIDWIRTDLACPCPDGTTSLFFSKTRFAYFDCHILGRKDAARDYTPQEMARVEALAHTITPAEEEALVDTIIVKTQGFIHGNIRTGERHPVALFRRLLAPYEGMKAEDLRDNLRYFLREVIPVCETWGINLCIHPDDPPWPVLGLPRIVTGGEDIARILRCVDNPRNGLTFCAGSLSAGAGNDLPDLARRFAGRTHYVHLRSTELLPGGDFREASHLQGGGRLVEVARIFEEIHPGLPMRIDHGRLMFDDATRGYNPGYSFFGRMYALAQMDGVLAAIHSLESHQPLLKEKQ